MTHLLRSFIIIGLALQLCNGTHYWKRPRQVKCVHSCGSSNFKNSTTCCKSTQFNYSKNSISDLEKRLQNIDSASAEDSNEDEDDSHEDLDIRDRQSTQKLQTFVQSRALTKKINKKQINIENKVIKRKTAPSIANKVVIKATGARSVNNKLIDNNYQKSFQQSSTTTTSSNTVSVSGGNIFLSIPEGYIANTVSTTTTRLLTEQDAIRLGLLNVMSTSENKIYSTYQNDDYSNKLGNSISRSTNSNTLLVKNNENSNVNYQNIKSQMNINKLQNSNSQNENRFTSINHNNNNNIETNSDYESSKNYQNTMGRSYNLKNNNVSRRFTQIKQTNNNVDCDSDKVNIDNNQKKQNSDIKLNYRNTKISRKHDQHITNNYNNNKDNNESEKSLSSQSNSVEDNVQSNLVNKKINEYHTSHKTEVKDIKKLGSQVDTTLKSDKSSNNESNESSTLGKNSEVKFQALNKHKITSVYKHDTASVHKTNSEKNTSTEDNSNTEEDTNSSSSDEEVVNKINNNSKQINIIKKQNVNITNKRNIKLQNNVYSKENTNTNKREINVKEIEENKTNQFNNKNNENDINNKNINIENDSVSSTHKTVKHTIKKNYYKTYNSENEESEENNNIVDNDYEYDDESVEEDDEVSTYEYINSYRKFRFDSGLNAVGIIGEVLSQLDYQRYKIIEDNIYPRDCTHNIINGEEFHFIIVGGGNAGCVLANKLSQNHNWNILLIEAGGDALPITQIPGLWDRALNSFTDWQYKIEPDYTTGFGISGNMKIHKGIGLGGSSTICAQQYVRGSEKMYNLLGEKGIEGWSYNTTETYFKKIEKTRTITKTEMNSTIYGNNGFIPVNKIRKTEVSTLENVISSGFEHIGYKNVDINDKNIEVGFVSMQGIIKNGRAINTAKAYLSPIFRRENLKVMKYSRVTKVIIDQIKMKATGIEVQTKFGKTLTLKASLEVLICAGAIGSSKILLASGIGPEKHLSQMDVPVVKNLPVGENLLITPVFTGFVMSYDKPIVSNQSNEEIAFNYLARNSGLLSFPKGMNFGGFLNTGVTKSAFSDIEVHQFYVPKNSPSKLCQLKSMFGFSDNLLSVYSKLNNERAFSIFTIALINPKSNGKVLLRSTNPLENPIIIGNMLSDQDDVKSLLEAIKILSKIEKSDAMKLVNATLEGINLDGCAKYDKKTDKHWECLLKYMVSTTSSTAGSCRMGLKTDPDAVVDSELNVIGISNLRVIGRSVMPMITSAYSHSSCIMIAERAYDIIQTKYNI